MFFFKNFNIKYLWNKPIVPEFHPFLGIFTYNKVKQKKFKQVIEIENIDFWVKNLLKIAHNKRYFRDKSLYEIISYV